MIRIWTLPLLLLAFSAGADTYTELTRDGSRAQALLDSVAAKASRGSIDGMDLLCPTYSTYNGDRTKRSLVWSQIIAAVGSPAEEVLASVDTHTSVRPVIAAMKSAKNVAAVNSYCRGLPVPNENRPAARPEPQFILHHGYSTARVYKLPESNEYVMPNVGAPGDVGTLK